MQQILDALILTLGALVYIMTNLLIARIVPSPLPRLLGLCMRIGLMIPLPWIPIVMICLVLSISPVYGLAISALIGTSIGYIMHHRWYNSPLDQEIRKRWGWLFVLSANTERKHAA